MTETTQPRIHVIQNAEDVGLDLLAPGLDGAQLEVVHPYRGDALPAVQDVHALIVLGGAANAYDDEAKPYLPQLRDLLSAAVDRDVPTLAVCLGAQLLAVARGGQVHVAAPAGAEIGVIEVRLRPDAERDVVLGPLVAAKGATVQVPSLHMDAITELPEGACWLAASRQYPFQAFRIGSALGVQFHPEVSGTMLASWIRRHGLEDAERIADEVRAQWDASAQEITEVADLLSRAFAAQVGAQTGPQVGKQVGALEPLGT
ncbi:type 1 glutamine amidotransferase [Pseudactinotalea sp. Z1739]|uniref:type 1 glutamine amidotransferase n=1 Tax=Pseudactinotalea sp. Z1739 TaxID=3413028 RepID=UPI003C7AE7A1